MYTIHLLRNINGIHKKISDTVFHGCARAYNVIDFEYKMRQYQKTKGTKVNYSLLKHLHYKNKTAEVLK